MNLNSISAELSKDQVESKIESYLLGIGLKLVKKDFTRPWGGFFVVDENQIRKFKSLYFDEVNLTAEQFLKKLSPKILVVSPHARLSWQYHHRRAELWKLIHGEAGIVRSPSDEEGELLPMQKEKLVSLDQGERHRLVGLNTWGIVAEIWMHTDPNNPSDEEDIVRVQDDYSRK